MEEPAPLRAVTYARISELTDTTTSPERQLADCRKYAEAQGWRIVAEADDLDISGRKGLDRREGLAAAIAMIERKEADVLVATKIDRVARSIVTFHTVVDRVQAAGGSLVLVAEGIDFSTPSGRMIANVLASFAQFESETIGKRVTDAQRYLTSQGKWRGGRRPFGWTPAPHPSGKGRVLVIDPVEGPLLQAAVDHALGGGPLVDITRRWNEAGVTTPSGSPWDTAVVRLALRTKALFGDGGAEAMIDAETYAGLQKALAVAEPTRKRAARQPSLLDGVLTCGGCGSPMRAITANKYRCTARHLPGLPGCGLTIAKTRTNEAVTNFFLGAVGDAPVSTPSGEIVDPAAEDRADIERRLSELEQDRYVRGLFSGDDGAERFTRIYGDLERRLADLPEPQYIEGDSLVPTGRTVAEVWAEADLAYRAFLLNTAVTVTINKAPVKGSFNPDRIVIRWVS